MTVQAITLCFLTLTLLNVFLPFPLDTVVPLIPALKFQVGNMCHELDGAWDETWLEQCGAGFAIVRGVAAFLATCMMSAQWWALMRVWQWGRVVRNETSKVCAMDVEKAESFEDEKIVS